MSRKMEDLTDNIYGRLMVIEFSHSDKHNNKYWKCECSCKEHNIVTVQAGALKTGATTSCGCYNKERSHLKNFNDLTDNIYGYLKVLGVAYKKGKNYYWRCKCFCGGCTNETIVRSDELISGNTKSCGCLNRKPKEDLTGRSFNDFIVEGYYGNGRWKCKCKCKCGNIRYIRTDHIKHEDIISCGHNQINHFGSYPELEIRDYIEFITGEDFVKCRILNGKEIDLYSDVLKLGIEYNGSWCHASENNPYENKDKYYHRDKFLLARSKGIHLITVFDIDYESNKNYIKSIIDNVINAKSFILPQNEIEYTDNDYDDGSYMKDYGYIEIGQEEPKSFIYQDKYVVYRCGRTIWKKVR